MRYVFVIVFSCVFSWPAIWCPAEAPAPAHHLDRVVCLESRVASQPNTGKLCSAFVVKAGTRLYLVTAGHGSAETNGDSRLRYRDPHEATQWVTLGGLLGGSSNPWHRDATSDFAVAEIRRRSGNEAYVDHLTALSIPLESLRTESPPRTSAVVTLGFPLTIGTRDGISPVAVPGHVASREIATKSKWGREPIVFCAPALAQGTSGGPTMLMASREDSIAVVGMYVGVVQDASGAKLSKMVPARLIRASITALEAEAEAQAISEAQAKPESEAKSEARAKTRHAAAD